jgi:mono/diheme cytochrome c family protein
MRAKTTIPTILLLLVTAVVFTRPARSEGEDRPDPGKMFANKCASCHAVPDPGLPADKVWINQVRETT